jgi:hypothetical protein
MTKFVTTYDGNGGERKAQVQGARRGDDGCAGRPGSGRGCGGETAGAHVGQVPVGGMAGRRQLHVGTARVWMARVLAD